MTIDESHFVSLELANYYIANQIMVVCSSKLMELANYYIGNQIMIACSSKLTLKHHFEKEQLISNGLSVEFVTTNVPL